MARVAVIGGSGLYNLEGLTDLQEVRPTTPFGEPSDVILLGRLEGVEVAFLPRHGRGHRLNPSEVPSRANIFALKALGVERIVSVSAVGSLREEVRPLDMVVPDQLIDRTRGRPATFFQGRGVVVHIAFDEPFCPQVRSQLVRACQEVGVTVHNGGAYIVIEGPAFSTRAESHLYRSWGASVIGMTALPEARLAREAEMCYATLACVTDYDTWHPQHASVTVEVVLQNLQRNTAAAREVLRRVLPRLTGDRDCSCASALASAIVTPRERIPDQVRRELAPLLGKYLG